MYDLPFTLWGRKSRKQDRNNLLCWLEKTVAAGPQGHVYSSNSYISHANFLLQFPGHFLSWADSDVRYGGPRDLSRNPDSRKGTDEINPARHFPKMPPGYTWSFLILDPQEFRAWLPASTGWLYGPIQLFISRFNSQTCLLPLLSIVHCLRITESWSWRE